ncbi:uncharacterized protein MELLADRAFT_91505 [Melampsora larici-populina 98AG31]|uniref:Uncharacterized protein n=1 Tax=Melampsora larici-populina (strain 98AG31 / pathotype 3-4-7) TaxID=747676 RepID=F4RZ99_MELLP|nr:uncharacterized protein MELLADRAFT_91505 [Melampsora larici-populina 98AG31]EGG02186.1 hypothetical protein MELLADRAFT_91505 [Melampsora larici-populina 98AG31]
MADPTESTTHGLYLTGNFEIEKKTSPENGWRAEYRTYATSITSGGAHRERSMSYEIIARGFSHTQFKLEPGNIYLLRGSFFPSNSEETNKDILFFEASDRVLISSSANFTGNLVDSIGVTGVGIVKAITKIPEPRTNGCLPNPADEGKFVTVVTVLHSDYHPIAKEAKQCTVQYRIPPTRNLAGTPKILQIGREYQFHGFLKDFDEEALVYIVIANKVSPTTGSKEYDVGTNASNDTKGDQKPQISRKKPVKFTPRALNTPFKSPVLVTESESTPDLKFGPSDFSPSSFLSGSGEPTAGPSGSSPNTALSSFLPTPPNKRKTRALPKRANKKGKTVDLS